MQVAHPAPPSGKSMTLSRVGMVWCSRDGLAHGTILSPLTTESHHIGLLSRRRLNIQVDQREALDSERLSLMDQPPMRYGIEVVQSGRGRP